MFRPIYYVDILCECQSCKRPFIFFALEQLHWYETLRFKINSKRIFCSICQHNIHTIREKFHNYSKTVQKNDISPEELKLLVDDSLYLFTHGVLKNLNNLGCIKNQALKFIPDYAGTRALAQALADARVPSV